MTCVPRSTVENSSDKAALRPTASHWSLVFLAVIAFVVPIAYALYTGHTWEDYFITFRHSANLVHGLGLVYNPGERVHGFTSPLGVLLPAFFYAITGAKDYLPALWLFRIASAFAFAGACVLLVKLMLRAGCRGWTAALLACIVILDAKSVAFSANGQETGFMLLFLAWSLYAAFDPRGIRIWQIGVAWAGLQWTRPDGCVYIVLCSAGLLFLARRDQRKKIVISLIKAAVICAVLYAPWFIFAWVYYGSPVPNTVRAKAFFTQEYLRHPDFASRAWVVIVAFWHLSSAIFQPVYSLMKYWPAFLEPVIRLSSIICLIYWLLPTRDRVGRTASLMFTGLCVYFSLTAMFPWYAPPAAVLGLLTLACAINTVWRLDNHKWLKMLAGAFAIALVAQQAVIFAGTCRQMLIQQTEIENGLRKPIGLWLRDHVRPGDRVYLESLGYIGYFSNAYMMDFPGLVSPQVVKLRRSGLEMAQMVAPLKPEWIVVRPFELEDMRTYTPDFDQHYQVVAIFDARKKLQQYGSFYGSDYVTYDQTFYVAHRVK